MFIITIIILITQQSVQNRLTENQPTAGLSSLNEYENGMGKSETELLFTNSDSKEWEKDFFLKIGWVNVMDTHIKKGLLLRNT